MKIAVIFHKNPFIAPSGIDLVRLRNIVTGLNRREHKAVIFAPVSKGGNINEHLPVLPIEELSNLNFDVIKTCYHPSIRLVPGHDVPIISRLVRVVDAELPKRDSKNRHQLLEEQSIIAEKSNAVVFNNAINAERWVRFYGNKQRIAIIPTGCPEYIPDFSEEPVLDHLPVMLFLGSIASERMLRILNRAAELLHGKMSIHFVGLNKAKMYGGILTNLSPYIKAHGEIPEEQTWYYIWQSQIGLALAAGPETFDNDISKIYNYLRGGLPVLLEERIANSHLLDETAHGATFRFDDPENLAEVALGMLQRGFKYPRSKVMKYMARNHSWAMRIEMYIDLFTSILNER